MDSNIDLRCPSCKQNYSEICKECCKNDQKRRSRRRKLQQSQTMYEEPLEPVNL